MIRGSEILILAVLLISNVLAQCNETQIDINSASLEELDNLTGVGPVIAQNIINARPFNSVDDLLNVSRIGNKTLEKIKQQGLACVSSENGISDIPANNSLQEVSDSSNNSSSELNPSVPAPDIPDITSAPKKPIVAEVIPLTPLDSSDSKNIKTNNNLWSPDKIAVYGFIAFSVLIIALFIMRMRKNPKTEFET
jgi:competence ComEA-like helix-hairpin-helix protein